MLYYYNVYNIYLYIYIHIYIYIYIYICIGCIRTSICIYIFVENNYLQYHLLECNCKNVISKINLSRKSKEIILKVQFSCLR